MGCATTLQKGSVKVMEADGHELSLPSSWGSPENIVDGVIVAPKGSLPGPTQDESVFEPALLIAMMPDPNDFISARRVEAMARRRKPLAR